MKKNGHFLDSYPGACIIFAENFLFRIKNTQTITPKTGKIVGVRIAVEEDDVMLVTNTGTIIRLKVNDISVLGRSTQGVTLMRTNDGGKVVSIETLNNEVDENKE